ncbi:MAG: DUF2027 domain-containing protein [Bacteroidales bacterium]
MNYQVGEKVKFLNEEGGGVISKIITPTLVYVMIEDGFEIPTATSNLVKVELSNAAGRFFYKEDNILVPEQQDIQQGDPEIAFDRISPLLKLAGKKQPPQGIYLAFIPHDQKWLISGLLDIYIVNNTEYSISYTYYLTETDKSYTGMDMDTIPAFSRVYLQTIDREELKDWNQGVVQVIFFKESLKKVPLPASCSFSVRENKFLKEDNYVASSIIESRAILTMLVELAKQGSVSARESEGKKEDKEPNLLLSKDFKEPALIDTHKIAPGEAEIDLHIEELVDSEKGLSPEQILKIQLDYFIKCLESALKNNYHRLIFIHGVGNGTLKMEIRQILDTYEGIQHHIAPMAKYGVGAIEINIFHNR